MFDFSESHLADPGKTGMRKRSKGKMEVRCNERGGKGGAWVICSGELDAVEGILFKWVTEAAKKDIYHT